MERVIARNELKQEFTEDNKALQVLAGKPGELKDPDDNLGSTVYAKGAWFMQFLEQRIGRADFDRVPARLLRPLRVPVDLLAAVRRLRQGQPARQVSGQGHPGRVRRMAA
jgi:hypothetical protein